MNKLEVSDLIKVSGKKNKVMNSQVKNTFLVISRLLVDMERCNWAYRMERAIMWGEVLKPYEACGGLAVGTKNTICAKIVIC